MDMSTKPRTSRGIQLPFRLRDRSHGRGPAVNFARCCALVAGLPLLTACATTTTTEEADPEQRIADAKARTQEFESRVAGFVPNRYVDDVDQLATGSLLSCDSGDRWAGGITIRLSSDVKASTALRELGANAVDAGLDVRRSMSLDGTERVTVSEADGASVLLDVADQSIEGGSFSACFSLPDEFYRGGEF